MSLAPSAIRTRIAAAIEAVDGWNESRLAFDLFPGDTRQLAHLAFAVGITSTTPDPGDRQRASIGVLANTTAAVRWAHRIRGDAQVGDYGDALDAELDMVAAIKALDGDPDLGIRIDSIPSRSVVADGTYLLGEVSLVVMHRYPLG